MDEFGARYYASALGRFTIPDWAANATAVPYADFGNPQTLNLYSYVKNNPLRDTDADGHCCDVDDVLDAIDFIAGFVNAAASSNGVAPRKDAAGDQTFASGQVAGDVATTIQGVGEVVLGSGVKRGENRQRGA